jgi:hypothetical protein
MGTCNCQRCAEPQPQLTHQAERADQTRFFIGDACDGGASLCHQTRIIHIKLAVDRGRPRKQAGSEICGPPIPPIKESEPGKTFVISARSNTRVVAQSTMTNHSAFGHSHPAKNTTYNRLISNKPPTPSLIKIATILSIKSACGMSKKGKQTMESKGEKHGENVGPPLSIAYDPSYLVVENKRAWLDDYEVISTLGRGGYGKVQKVRHRKTGRCYALKIIHRNRCADNAELLNEVEVLKKLVLSRLISRTIQTLCESMSSRKTRRTSISSANIVREAICSRR